MYLRVRYRRRLNEVQVRTQLRRRSDPDKWCVDTWSRSNIPARKFRIADFSAWRFWRGGFGVRASACRFRRAGERSDVRLFQTFATFERLEVRTMEHSDRTFERSNVRTFERWNVGTLERSNVRTFQRSSVRTFERSNV